MVEVKREVRELFAAVTRKLETEMDELRGNIVHVDELTARRLRVLDGHVRNLIERGDQHDARLTEVEAVLADNAQHSRKVCAVVGCQLTRPHTHMPGGVFYT